MCFFHLSEGVVVLFKKHLICLPLLGTISSTSQCSPDLAEQVSNFCSPYGASGCFLGPDQRALFIAIMFHQDDIYVGIKILNHNPGEGCQGKWASYSGWAASLLDEILHSQHAWHMFMLWESNQTKISHCPAKCKQKCFLAVYCIL